MLWTGLPVSNRKGLLPPSDDCRPRSDLELQSQNFEFPRAPLTANLIPSEVGPYDHRQCGAQRSEAGWQNALIPSEPQ